MAADALLEPFGPADRDHLIAAGDRAGRAPSRPAATRILRFLAAILDQNRRVNLTAVRDPAAALALQSRGVSVTVCSCHSPLTQH